MDGWVFMKFTEYDRYHTRNNGEHVGDVAFNPLETGFFFYVLGPYSLATLWGVNGFS